MIHETVVPESSADATFERGGGLDLGWDVLVSPLGDVQRRVHCPERVADRGREVASFRTLHDGLARFDLTMARGRTYQARQGVGWRVPELLAAARVDPDFYFDALSQVRMPSWSAGRVALVGDAAACASLVAGAGAMLAMVAAYRLAGALVTHPDHDAAFRGYEARHRKLVEQRQSHVFTGLLVPRTRLGIWVRNTTARLSVLNALSGLESRSTEPLPSFEA